MAHLREVVGISLVRHAEHAGAVPVADGARIPKVEAWKVLRDVGHDDPRLSAIAVQETHPDDVVFGVALRERLQDRMRSIEVERHGIGRRIDIAARSLGDPQEKDDLPIELRGRGIEDARRPRAAESDGFTSFDGDEGVLLRGADRARSCDRCVRSSYGVDGTLGVFGVEGLVRGSRFHRRRLDKLSSEREHAPADVGPRHFFAVVVARRSSSALRAGSSRSRALRDRDRRRRARLREALARPQAPPRRADNASRRSPSPRPARMRGCRS